MRGSQLLTQSKPHVFHIPARTVDQNNRGLGTGRMTCKSGLGHVQTRAFNLDELSGWRVCGLDPRDPERGHGDERTKSNNKSNDESCKRHTFSGSGFSGVTTTSNEVGSCLPLPSRERGGVHFPT